MECDAGAANVNRGYGIESVRHHWAPQFRPGRLPPSPAPISIPGSEHEKQISQLRMPCLTLPGSSAVLWQRTKTPTKEPWYSVSDFLASAEPWIPPHAKPRLLKKLTTEVTYSTQPVHPFSYAVSMQSATFNASRHFQATLQQPLKHFVMDSSDMKGNPAIAPLTTLSAPKLPLHASDAPRKQSRFFDDGMYRFPTTMKRLDRQPKSEQKAVFDSRWFFKPLTADQEEEKMCHFLNLGHANPCWCGKEVLSSPREESPDPLDNTSSCSEADSVLPRSNSDDDDHVAAASESSTIITPSPLHDQTTQTAEDVSQGEGFQNNESRETSSLSFLPNNEWMFVSIRSRLERTRSESLPAESFDSWANSSICCQPLPAELNPSQEQIATRSTGTYSPVDELLVPLFDESDDSTESS
ncbi:hypothetical protein ACN47E_006427 [Coniothyrium glycines]